MRASWVAVAGDVALSRHDGGAVLEDVEALDREHQRVVARRIVVQPGDLVGLGGPFAIGGDQLELADGWWELGGDDTSQQKALRLRAAHWYARARDTLPAGLFRVKAEMRLRQIKKEYGQSALDAAINGRAR